MPETSESMALLQAMARDGVVTIDDQSPTGSLADRLHHEGMIRWAGPSTQGRRPWVLSGRGLRAVRGPPSWRRDV